MGHPNLEYEAARFQELPSAIFPDVHLRIRCEKNNISLIFFQSDLRLLVILDFCSFTCLISQIGVAHGYENSCNEDISIWFELFTVLCCN